MTLKSEGRQMATGEDLVVLPEAAISAAMAAIEKADEASVDWDDENPSTLINVEVLARAALEAAAPYLMSIGYERGRDDEFQRSVMNRQTDPNPYEALTK